MMFGEMYSKFSKSFIECYDNALSKEECDILINQFEKNPEKITDGKVFSGTGYGIDKNIKSCREIENLKFSNGDIISNIIDTSLRKQLNLYVKKYPLLSTNVSHWDVEDIYNFQKYENSEDGYKNWHMENGRLDCCKRILVWSFYLNNAKSGTEFYNHSTIKAKRGRCVIWPAGPTTFHRSQPNKGLKYIVTGWCGWI